MQDQNQSTTTHYRACNLCEAICGLSIEVTGGAITRIRGDKDDPFSRGHVCAKAVALKDLHEDPDRLRRPLHRTAKGFQEIGWDEALTRAAAGLRTVRDAHGAEALAVYQGNPNVHNWGSMLFGPELIKALRPRNRYSATSVDQLPHHVAAYYLFGHQMLLPVPDIDRTDFFLIMGGNPIVSNGSLMTAPDFRNRMKAIQARGGRVVVVDPRRTETATRADWHLFVRPAGDAALLAAMLNVVFDEGLADPGRLEVLCTGLERLPTLFAPFTPEAVLPVTGVDAGDVRRLAREFCSAGRAVAHGRIGLSLQTYGGLCQWLVGLLNIVTGNFDRPGGAMFTTPAVDVVANTSAGSHGRFRSRTRGLAEFGGELPAATMAEDMLGDAAGRTRALLTVAGNPVLSTPNGAQLDRALTGLDFMVSIDFYLNETTRHADIILPPTAPLEHDHYDVIFNMLAVRNVARYSPAVFAAGPETRHDWQIYLELAGRLQDGGLRRRLRAGIRRRWMKHVGPTGVLDRLVRKGPRGQTLGFRTIAAAVHGLDLGPLEPCLPACLHTPDKRIQLAPAPMATDLERLHDAVMQTSRSNEGLLLIGRRQPRSNNSWLHNFPRLVKGPRRCTLLMHPDDAAHLELADGDVAQISSRVGAVDAPVEVSDEIMAGVVSLPHGWGHQRPGTQLATAALHPGVSINDLTDHEAIDPLSGNAALNGVPVTVCRAESRDHG